MLEKVFSLILSIVSLFVFYLASNFDMDFIGPSGLGPDFFPKIISVILFFLGIIIFINKIRNEKKEEIKDTDIKSTLSIIGIFALYIFLIGKIGYLVSTILFSLMAISILSKESFVLKILYSIIFPLALYLLFTYAFKVSLPTGILI